MTNMVRRNQHIWSTYSNLVFNRLAICDDRSQGDDPNHRVLNRRYNVNTHEVLLSFLHKIERNGK
jgi:hypothetical protein